MAHLARVGRGELGSSMPSLDGSTRDDTSVIGKRLRREKNQKNSRRVAALIHSKFAKLPKISLDGQFIARYTIYTTKLGLWIKNGQGRIANRSIAIWSINKPRCWAVRALELGRTWSILTAIMQNKANSSLSRSALLRAGSERSRMEPISRDQRNIGGAVPAFWLVSQCSNV